MRHPVQNAVRIVLSAAVVMTLGHAAAAQAPAAPSASSAKAKELAALMKEKKLEAFAIRENVFENRFNAVMIVPDVQTLLVSAVYSRPSDIEYRLYQKDYSTAYGDLRNGALGSDRFMVEDVLGDGLVAVPAKNALADTVIIGTTHQVLDGPADPRKKKDTRMALEPYMKAFGEADQRYAALLDGMITELKKAGVVAPTRHLR